MCKTLALLSGKGGSGKTTLALSMATLLSSCGIKVLLIDCDLSTNGATYFYEERLAAERNRVTSFYDLLCGNSKNKKRGIEISASYHFMPSITQISNHEIQKDVDIGRNLSLVWGEVSQKYDVVLFDCQAGYTEVLKVILPVTDISLIVMETDSISSAAIRSLYLKIGDIINEKKLYQVFNKASQEEYDIYSKVSGGTVFTNLDTILFDWKIRKAFAVSQIPDLENTSANYGTQIYNLCKLLFANPEIQKKLGEFEIKLKLQMYRQKETETLEKIDSLGKQMKKKRQSVSRRYIYMMLLVCTIISCVVFAVGISNYNGVEKTTLYMLLPIVISAGSLLISGMSVIDSTKDKDLDTMEMRSLEKALIETREQIECIQHSIVQKAKRIEGAVRKYKRDTL